MLYNIISIFGVLLLLTNNAIGISRVDPLVDTNVGLIRGLRATDGDYSMFLGIPYAIVDESNPFGRSSPAPRFEDTFEAYDDSAICPQKEEFENSIVGTLDCLHLNIYVPSTASSQNRLPVLVWIHGGGFAYGFSGRYLYGAKYLVRHDVILVTINYRLGPYGFMCLNDTEISGNQGLKDQLAALRWIKNNIDAFGGDSNKITIFGESAGGASVDLHLLYSQDNLFQNVIMQSGSAQGHWTVQGPNDEAPLQLAEHLGFSAASVEEALKFLATVETDLVIAATLDLNVSFGPCTEHKFENVENYILEYPLNVKVKRNIPVLLGYNSDEASSFIGHDQSYFDNTNMFYDYLNNYFTFDDAGLKEMEEIIRHFYIGDQSITTEQVQKLRDFTSDTSFTHPTERSIQKYIREGVNTIYYYMFSYTGYRNFVKTRLNITEGGASHADEIGYLFDISFWQEEPTFADQLIIDRMTELWTNFAKYSNPTPQTNEILPFVWSPVTESTLYYLNIDTDIILETRPFHDRMAFWDLFYKLNAKYQREYKEIDPNRR